MPIGGIPTGWDIRVMYYRNYLSSLERFLENEAKILDERYEAEVRKAIEGKERVSCGDYTLPGQLSEEERDALEYFFFGEEYELEDIFPNMLRRSFFVSIYSLIEAQLNEICYEQERTKELPWPLEKVKKAPDRSIQRAKVYLMDVAKIRFPKCSEWEELMKYKNLRNCIVHNEGRLEGLPKKYEEVKEELKQYISGNPNLALKPHDDEIIFHKGFCEEVLQVSRRFFTKLFAALRSKEEGDF